MAKLNLVHSLYMKKNNNNKIKFAGVFNWSWSYPKARLDSPGLTLLLTSNLNIF